MDAKSRSMCLPSRRAGGADAHHMPAVSIAFLVRQNALTQFWYTAGPNAKNVRGDRRRNVFFESPPKDRFTKRSSRYVYATLAVTTRAA